MRLLDLVTPIAEHQLGLAARRQLLAEGVSPDSIDAAVRRGHLDLASRAVYRVPGAPVTPASRLLAMLLAAGPDAVLSHESAAWWWGLCDAPLRHTISVPRPRRIASPGVIVRESSDLDLAVIGLVNGVPVTGIGRTILDCAANPKSDLELLVDAARRKHQISRTLLPHVVVRHARQGRPGIARLRSVLEVDELPDSDFERLFARWLREVGITGWDLHHRIVIPTFGPLEIDIAWPAPKIALELEGNVHARGSVVHERDTVRQNHLLLDGWAVLRVTYRRWLRSPDAVRFEIESALRQRP